MPDPLEILKALIVAGGVAAAVLLGFAWTRRPPPPTRLALGACLGVMLGLVMEGLWVGFGLTLRWPPLEVSHRLFILLFPAAILAELLWAVQQIPRAMIWGLRILAAFMATPILLYESVYVAEVDGATTEAWTQEVRLSIYGGLGLALLAVWGSMALLRERPGERWQATSLALTCLGAALALMLSGSLTVGLQMLPVAAAILGITAASWAVTPPYRLGGAIGVAVVLLFGILVSGLFFAELRPLPFALLFGAPLMAALPEIIPSLKQRSPTLRGVLSVVLVCTVVALGIATVFWPGKDTSTPASNSAPSVQDYLDFGK